MKNIRIFIFILTAAALIAACSGMNDLHDQYLKGEDIYVAKCDSFYLYSGKNRVVLAYWMSDPKARKARAFWSLKSDSLTFDVGISKDKIPATVSIDRNDAGVAGLPEGMISFDFFTYNERFGNRSVPMSATTMVYGDRYVATLLNCTMKNNVVGRLGKILMINWNSAPENAVGIQLSYLTTAGTVNDTIVPIEATTVLPRYPGIEDVKYSTLYCPENCVDTFRVASSFISPQDPAESKLNKSLIKRYPLPGDNTSDYNATTRSFLTLFDDLVNDFGWHTAGTTAYPVYFTVDLGVEARLTRFTLYQRITATFGVAGAPYSAGNPKTFKVYGTANPGDSTDPSYWTIDGGFASDWTLLADCTVPKLTDNSALNQEDYDYAKLGHEFHIPDDAPIVRYVRFYVDQAWNPSPTNFHFSELTFMGIVSL